jgi:methylmalonyl-CoA mutase
VIVGVNRFVLEEEPAIDILQIDNKAVRAEQMDRLAQLKRNRNDAACKEAVANLRQAATGSTQNLLQVAIEAARARATLGEISTAMEETFGRHHAVTRVISGVYNEAYQDDPEYQAIQRKLGDYAASTGHPPRILIAKMGQDGHDRGAKVIATAFADMGFDVEISDMFMTPIETAAMAIDSKIDVIGVSSLAAGHQQLVPELINELALRRASIMVVCGGVIPEQDYADLYDAGVAAIFGPGSNVLDAANTVLAEISGLRRNR